MSRVKSVGILAVLVLSAVACFAAPNGQVEGDFDFVVEAARNKRSLTLDEVEEFVKRSNEKYMMFPVDNVEMAKRTVEDALQARVELELEQQQQLQKRYSECTRLECNPVKMGDKDYIQCNRVPATCPSSE